MLFIRTADSADLVSLQTHDSHISPNELENAVALKRVYIAEVSGEFVGWLRYNLFWDNTPFMNMLYVLEPHRGKGFGKKLVEHWESCMCIQGFEAVMTSTASDEYAQHFYARLGYSAVGGFTPHGEPYELIFAKRLRRLL